VQFRIPCPDLGLYEVDVLRLQSRRLELAFPAKVTGYVMRGDFDLVGALVSISIPAGVFIYRCANPAK